MSVEQVVIIIFVTVVLILAIWNLVLSLQNRKINLISKKIKYENHDWGYIKEKEEKKDYYGRFK